MSQSVVKKVKACHVALLNLLLRSYQGDKLFVACKKQTNIHEATTKTLESNTNTPFFNNRSTKSKVVPGYADEPPASFILERQAFRAGTKHQHNERVLL